MPGRAEPPHPRERAEGPATVPVDAEQLQVDRRPPVYRQRDRRRCQPLGGHGAGRSQRVEDPVTQRLHPCLDLEAPQRLWQGLGHGTGPQDRPGRRPARRPP
jgi:hypothetical protein